MNKPYVDTGDLKTLLTENWTEDWQTSLWPALWGMRTEFGRYMRSIFPNFEFVPEEELEDCKEYLCEKHRNVIDITHKKRWTDVVLGISRTVDEEGRDKGYAPRSGAASLVEQVRVMARGQRSRVIWDDVIYSGSFVHFMVTLLKQRGVIIKSVIAGVGVKAGCDRLRAQGITVDCVREYSDAIDVVCERDFYPGVPFSGRTLAGSDNVSIPYLLPFGKPGEWASIPKESQEHFSRFCIEQTISLFEVLEKRSRKKITCSDLPRKVVGLPRDGTRFIDALKQVLLDSSLKNKAIFAYPPG